MATREADGRLLDRLIWSTLGLQLLVLWRQIATCQTRGVLGRERRNRHIINAGHVTLRGAGEGMVGSRGKGKGSREATDATTVRSTLVPNRWAHSAESGSGISLNFSRLFILSTSTRTKLYSIPLLPIVAAARLLLVPYLLCLGCGVRLGDVTRKLPG